jgi:hypothetical protein
MAERTRWHGDVLRMAVTEHDWSRPPPGMAALLEGRPHGDLVDTAVRHGVAAAVHLSTRGLDALGAEASVALSGLHHHGVARHLRTIADLAWVGRELDAIGAPWLVMKGPVLAASVYALPELRSYGDLDVVVEPAAFPRVVAHLESAGVELLDHNWQLAQDERRGQVHLALPSGTVVDLHWHLVNRGTVRSSLDVATTALFDRSRRMSIGPVEVPTLDPVDTLLHVATHAALAGGWRLQWIKDVERAATATDDWDAVVSRARSWRAGPLVGTMLRRTAAIGGTAPDEVTRALVGAVTRAVNAAVDRRWPAGDDLSAAAELWLRTRRHSVPWSVRLALDRYRASQDGLAMHDVAGDEQAKERFLASVGSGRWDAGVTPRASGRRARSQR